MKRAFSLIEILIVVAILGILAAIVMPEYLSHSQKAKEVTAKDNLRMLKDAIERYAVQHNGLSPGYRQENPSNPAGGIGILEGHLSPYLLKLPENPFNKLSVVKIIQNWEDFPAEPVEIDAVGWVYKPATKNVRLNWAGTDSEGLAYFDY